MEYSKGGVAWLSCAREERSTNHKALGQLTNQSTFRVSEGGASSKRELNMFETTKPENLF